jgi:hypothetical protein
MADAFVQPVNPSGVNVEGGAITDAAGVQDAAVVLSASRPWLGASIDSTTRRGGK